MVSEDMLSHKTFDDIDQQAAQLNGYGQHYAQLSAGRFKGVFSSFALLNGINVDIERVNQAMHQRASVPGNTMAIVTFLETGGACILNGRLLETGDSFILAPGTAFELRTPETMTVSVVSLPMQLVEDEFRVLLGPDQRWRPLKNPIALKRGTSKSDLLSGVLGTLVQEVLVRPELLDHDRNRSAIGGTILNGLFLAIGSAIPDRIEIMRPTPRWDVFSTARNALDEDLSLDISIPALCRAAGVSRRTLEYSFEEAIGLSPLQYLKLRRLNGIRRELSAADPGEVTIGDVAARYGVWHLGRLSRDYMDLFGELPSVTLRRGPVPGAA